MNVNKFCHVLEAVRWSCVPIGFWMAGWLGDNPAHAFHILMPWIVLPIAGLTGFESVFLGEAASGITGYVGGRGYQRQSGFNNLALAITALIAFLWKWGVAADVAVMTVLLVFLVFSAGNHAWSAWKDGNRGMRNLLRPVLTAALLVVTIPYMVRAMRYAAAHALTVPWN